VVQYSGQASGFGYIMPPMSNKALEDFIGFQHRATTQLENTLTKGSGTALGEAIFANWEELIWAQWGAIEIERSDDFRFDYNQVAFRVIADMDIGVRHAESFCLVNDANTTSP